MSSHGLIPPTADSKIQNGTHNNKKDATTISYVERSKEYTTLLNTITKALYKYEDEVATILVQIATALNKSIITAVKIVREKANDIVGISQGVEMQRKLFTTLPSIKLPKSDVNDPSFEEYKKRVNTLLSHLKLYSSKLASITTIKDADDAKKYSAEGTRMLLFLI